MFRGAGSLVRYLLTALLIGLFAFSLYAPWSSLSAGTFAASLYSICVILTIVLAVTFLYLVKVEEGTAHMLTGTSGKKGKAMAHGRPLSYLLVTIFILLFVMLVIAYYMLATTVRPL